MAYIAAVLETDAEQMLWFWIFLYARQKYEAPAGFCGMIYLSRAAQVLTFLQLLGRMQITTTRASGGR